MLIKWALEFLGHPMYLLPHQNAEASGEGGIGEPKPTMAPPGYPDSRREAEDGIEVGTGEVCTWLSEAG